MPTIYRSMFAAGNHPRVANDAKSLGVRVEGYNADIVIGDGGIVSPGMAGMSVSSAWQELPPHRIPSRLRPICAKAKGSNDYYCWRLGSGEFARGTVATDLMLEIDPDDATHGLVGPETKMSVASYMDALAATRDLWVIDEE